MMWTEPTYGKNDQTSLFVFLKADFCQINEKLVWIVKEKNMYLLSGSIIDEKKTQNRYSGQITY